MSTEIHELKLIDSIVAGIPRSPLQRNRVHESDAEILAIPGMAEVCLALTTDTVAEEISAGLYRDMHLAGWMAVMASMSDLAAVGADVLGMLMAETLPAHFPAGDLRALHEGMRDALAACGGFLLGGDTNFGSGLSLTATAVGVVPVRRALGRIGARPGDVLYVSGKAGLGNAFALDSLAKGTDPPVHFRPAARLTEGRALRGIASACIDSSDGLLAAIDQLARLNGVGMTLNNGWELTLHPTALRVSNMSHIPPWMFLAGQHGDFDLVFTVPPECDRRLASEAERLEWMPVRLGMVTATAGIALPLYGRRQVVDTGRIRNLWVESAGSLSTLLSRLWDMDRDFRDRRSTGHTHDRIMTNP
jgi:thiamine-monophosphate kinase